MREVRRGWSRDELLVGAGIISAFVIIATMVSCTSPGAEQDVAPSSAATPGSTSEPASPPIASASTHEASRARASRTVEGKRAAALMIVSPETVSEGARPSLVLKNTGATELNHSPGFKLEIRMPGGWYYLNRHQAFHDPLFHLRPGEESDPEDLAMYWDSPEPIPFPPGAYRVSKSMGTDPVDYTAPSLDLTATFRVVRESNSGETESLEPDRDFEPYPGNQWYGRDGEPIAKKAGLINVITGPDHCDWQRAAMLHLAWPPEDPSNPKREQAIQYVRDPDNVMGDKRLTTAYDHDATLPGGSRYSGYRTDFMELWVRTYKQGFPTVAEAAPPDEIYLVYEDHIESWPRAQIACA